MSENLKLTLVCLLTIGSVALLAGVAGVILYAVVGELPTLVNVLVGGVIGFALVGPAIDFWEEMLK